MKSKIVNLLTTAWTRGTAVAVAMVLSFVGAGALTIPAAAAQVPEPTPLADVAPLGVANCSVGYACLWDNFDYNGSAVGVSLSDGSLVGHSMNNKGGSAQANGGSCAKTMFNNANVYYGGNSGDIFVLWSKNLTGKNYKDPNLSNGAGFASDAPNGYNENHNNRVSSWQFYNC